MKILHVVASVNPSYGGPSVSAPSLAGAQANLGHKVTLLVQANRECARHAATLAKRLPITRNLEVIAVNWREIANQYILGRSSGHLHSVISAVDIVHVHGFWDLIIVSILLACRRLRKPYVISPRGMLNRWSLAQGALKKRVVLRLLMKDLLTGSFFVHALNSNEASEIKSLCPCCKVEVFPNGIDITQFGDLPPLGSFRLSLEAVVDRQYALFLGRLHRVKGLDFLIEAFALVVQRLDSFDLVIAGPDAGFQSFVTARINALGLASRIHVAGPLYGEHKFAAIRDALCVVQPSRQEGFSMSILEALGCGTPVVISQYCHFPEVAERGVGYVVPLQADRLADAICDLASRPDHRSTMSKEAIRLTREEYTWDAIAQGMIKAYQHFERSEAAASAPETQG